MGENVQEGAEHRREGDGQRSEDKVSNGEGRADEGGQARTRTRGGKTKGDGGGERENEGRGGERRATRNLVHYTRRKTMVSVVGAEMLSE